MYDYSPPASLGMRDVLAAWLVCLTVAAAAFVYPGFSPGTETQTALAIGASTGARPELCAVRVRQISEPHG
jgi:hypothetical protein